MIKNRIAFDEVFRQNERRYQYYKRYWRTELHCGFFNERLVVIWSPYRKWQSDAGVLATYFNYVIRNRMMDA
ncbi:hypothetical protein SAMN05216238_11413 [Lentibacillus persicus]|uniref:Uncharacterized protein n=1 Tax=Lentibacillus persicus TaxID=640948 RepID=A0A1I2A0G7_9BACI|nr:hypothetical protein [Lentibacillus persicus]SFE37359.1 hypothetical protein SAMN05216238_11413 [Lentibacillus persicus]